MTPTIRAYEPKPSKPAHLCAKWGCSNEKYATYRLCYAHLKEQTVERAEMRPLTSKEASLDAFASHMPDTVFVWHRAASGEYIGVHTITPDGIRIGVQTYNE